MDEWTKTPAAQEAVKPLERAASMWQKSVAQLVIGLWCPCVSRPPWRAGGARPGSLPTKFG